MRVRNWLLAGTSLTLLALAPLSAAKAQDATNPAVVAAFQAYQADQSDANKQALADACVAAGFQGIDDCLAVLNPSAAPAAPAEATPPPAEAAPPADATPAPAPAEQAPAEAAPPAEQSAPAAPAETAPPAEASPPAEAAPPADQTPPPPAEQPPAAAPAEQAPAEQAPVSSSEEAAPATTEAPAPAAPATTEAPATNDALNQLTAAVNLYNEGAADLAAGNADGQAKVDQASGQIQTICGTAGFTDVAACLAQFNLTLSPLPAPAAPAAPVSSSETPAAPATSEAPAPAEQPSAAPEQPSAPAEQPASSVEQPAPAEQPSSSAEQPSSAPETTSSSEQPAAQAPAADVPVTDTPQANETLSPSAVEPAPADVTAPLNPLFDADKTRRGPQTDQAQASAPADQSSSSQPPAPPPGPVTEAPATNQEATADRPRPTKGQQTALGEKGTAVTLQAPPPPQAPQAPAQQVKVVEQPKNDNGGVVFQIGINIFINNPEQERSRYYDKRQDKIGYEQLSHGRLRETVIRRDGTKIITVYNRNGDVLQRSKIPPKGREIILSTYDPSDEDLDNWRDPGDDLPPLRVNIKARDYILDADTADEEDVRQFLDRPPVEKVRRIYSVDEVKRSARLRDTVRRLEVGGLTFDSGKATISRNQVSALENVANAMQKLLDRNPGEVFLIEGHTDAVGPDVTNLVLSDQRAATVARILTDFYEIPPENLVTQGYGEQFLKVDTQAAEPLNRRVTIKRITPLVSYTADKD